MPFKKRSKKAVYQKKKSKPQLKKSDVNSIRNVPKIFVDIKVWFSAVYGSYDCYRILQAFATKTISITISQQVLTEIIRTFRQKLPHQLAEFEYFIQENPPEIIIDPKTTDKRLTKLVHSKDLPIFASAVLGNVSFFVTGNTRHFSKTKLRKLTGIEVVTPKELITTLKLKR